MKYDEDFLKKIVNFGILGYQLNKIINILDIHEDDVNQFTEDFFNKNSAVGKAYQKGIDKADFAIDTKLFDKAKEGDLKALEKYEQRKKQYFKQELKEKIMQRKR